MARTIYDSVIVSSTLPRSNRESWTIELTIKTATRQ
jgi:hypothetical protein